MNEPVPEGELQDEHLACLGKEYRSLRRNHAHVFVRLHDALDAGEGQVVVVLEVLLGTYLEILHLEVTASGIRLSC